MISKIESLGSRLLARLVPAVEASAATCSSPWGPKFFPSCYQCAGGAACTACCRSGYGCKAPYQCYY